MLAMQHSLALLFIAVFFEFENEDMNERIVNCTMDLSCAGESVVETTYRNCCSHKIAPFGVAYYMIRETECFPCPVGKKVKLI